MKITLFFLVALTVVAHASDKPNIVVILADDYGYGSAGCYGANPALVKTPNIDRLAREGRRFTDANTTSSVCSPTRYSVLTGRYCWRTSLTHEVLSTFAPLHIETTRLNLASLLKGHGYQTAAIGKWHLGYGTATDAPQWRTDYSAELSPGPLDIGFDYHFGVPSNHGDLTGVYVENRFVYGLRSGKIPPSMKLPGPVPDDDNFKPTYDAEDTEGGRGAGKILALDAPRRKNERVMATLTDKAVHWIEQQPKDKPFFLYFTPVAVHSPVTPDKDIAGQSAAGLFGDWITELDRSVGRILDTLAKQGVAENTLVIFTSDNGGVKEPAQKTTPQTAALNAGLVVNGIWRGGKHHVWEGGFKVPFIVRWPGHAPAGTTCDEMVSLADILATTAAVVGDKLPAAEKAAEDSYNILPAILDQTTAPVRTDMVVHSSDGVFAIRKGPWKWIEGVPVEDIKPGARKAHANEFREQLYNTHDDPGETTDVSTSHPDVVKELRALLVRYRDGGYSREMPPVVEKRKPETAVLPPLTGKIVLNETLNHVPDKPWLVARGEWTAKDGALWGAQKDGDQQAAGLRAPLAVTDAVLQYELCFRGANRHSLRVESSDRKHSFRIVVSRSSLEITKNPSQGETVEQTEPLARKALKLETGEWYPLRITFHGTEVTAEIAGAKITGKHPVIAEPKGAANFLVFDKAVGFRKVQASVE
ncbi:MAG: arylsulfatase [Chthoniobacter sp.]|uniref:sulfatase family protein n=1 Tax=Chthoniobacter sp. TaxID=2510640 RepID=UPI0032AD4824